ncbi:MAG TPA: hypothetical protein VGK00_02870 [Anaerolineales bacterium]|jgi:hypothetical protein
MTPPTVYTEKTLSDFMHQELGKVAVILAYTVGAGDAGSYAEAVNETLLKYGQVLIANATDISKIRALARVEAWKKACNDLAALYKFTSDDASYERNQIFDQAEKNLGMALTLSLPWDAGYQINVTRVRPVHDPYRYLPEEDRTL